MVFDSFDVDKRRCFDICTIHIQYRPSHNGCRLEKWTEQINYIVSIFGFKQAKITGHYVQYLA